MAEQEAQAAAMNAQANGHDGSGEQQDAVSQPSVQRQEIGTIEAGSLAAQSVSFVKPNKYHAIDDKELDALMKIEKPYSVAAAGIFTGVFCGTIYQASTAFTKITGGVASVALGEIIYIIVAASAFGAAIATSVMALRGKSDVVKALEQVRKRSKLYLPPNHPSTPPGSEGV